MPTVEVDYDQLRSLTGHDEKDDDELEWDLFNLGLEYEGETEDGDALIEFESDRLDRLSVEGIARSLRYQYGDDRGVYVPSTNDAGWTIVVEDDVPDERPYVTGAVVRGVDLGGDTLDSLIQLQEKLHATIGRNRSKGAIGVHDLTMLKGSAATTDEPKSIRYTGIEPDGEEFVPLESDEAMTPAEVLEGHHMGSEYADIVAEYERLPAIYDDVGLFSFPPVINGKRTEVTEDSRNLFIEMTGTDQWTIDKMLAIVCYTLDARGGTIERVDVRYEPEAAGVHEAGTRAEANESGAPGAPEPVDNDRLHEPGEDAEGVVLSRPDFSTKSKTVEHAAIERMLGIDLGVETVVDLAERSGLDATPVDGAGERRGSQGGDVAAGAAEAYEVEIPPYRTDVLHPVDVIDDIGRAYGFNELAPRYPDVSTVGGRHERSRLEDATREALVGLGYQDLVNFYMTSEAVNYERMGLDPASPHLGGGDPVTIQEPYSEDYTMLRTWALPSLMMVLERNTHRAYPQDLAEIGLVAEVDETENTNVAEHRTVATALARPDVSYEDAKARLQALARFFDVDPATPPTTHPTFLDGRTAEVVIDDEAVGVIGEVHPEVLVAHDLEVPVAAFEFRLDALADEF